MKKIRRLIRYPISTIGLCLGFCIAYIALLYCGEIAATISKEASRKGTYEYVFSETFLLRGNIDKTLPELEICEGNVLISSFDTYVDDSNGTKKTDIMIVENEDWNYPIIEQFPVEENVPSAYIGKGLLPYIFHDAQGNKKIYIFGEEYAVTKIIGDEKTVIFDYTVVLNINSIGEKMKTNINSMMYDGLELKLVSNATITNAIKEVFDELVDKDILFDMIESDVFFASEIDSATNYVYPFLIYVFAIFNCVIIARFYIKERLNEITIRKAFGFSNKRILFMILKELLALLLFSGVISIGINLVLQVILKNLLPITCTDIFVYGVSMLAYCLVTVVVISIYPLKVALAVTPAQILKGIE